MSKEPDFQILAIDDVALANGVKVNNALTVPDGYPVLCAIYGQGAGLEAVEIKLNDAYESQQIPGIDLAVDANVTQGEYGSSMLMINGMVVVNQPVKAQSKVSYTPHCTGVAAAYYLLMFGKRPLAGSPYTLYKMEDTAFDTSSAVLGATILGTVPVESGPVRLSRLAAGYLHGATANFTTIMMGRGGPSTSIPVKVGAVNAVERPAVWYPIECDLPASINFGGKSGGGTGAAQKAYFAFQ